MGSTMRYGYSNSKYHDSLIATSQSTSTGMGQDRLCATAGANLPPVHVIPGWYTNGHGEVVEWKKYKRIQVGAGQAYVPPFIATMRPLQQN